MPLKNTLVVPRLSTSFHAPQALTRLPLHPLPISHTVERGGSEFCTVNYTQARHRHVMHCKENVRPANTSATSDSAHLAPRALPASSATAAAAACALTPFACCEPTGSLPARCAGALSLLTKLLPARLRGWEPACDMPAI